MTDLIILSQNPDFAGTLAQAVSRELGLSAVMVQIAEEAQQEPISIVVTDMPPSGEWAAELLVVALPVRLHALLKRIEAAVKNTAATEVLAIGDQWQLSLLYKNLTHRPSNSQVALTDKELQILQMLAKCHGKIVVKETLLKTVWDMDSVLDTHTLETHIYRLRNKLRELPGGEHIIAAEGGGYKWQA